jgi:Na+-driven multidrug efflux pump
MAKYTLFLESLNIWIYEIISLMSGFLTVKDQAALAVDWNIKMLLIYLPYSFYLSITTLVGTSLGEGNVALSQRFGKLNFYLSLCFSIPIMIGA